MLFFVLDHWIGNNFIKVVGCNYPQKKQCFHSPLDGNATAFLKQFPSQNSGLEIFDGSSQQWYCFQFRVETIERRIFAEEGFLHQCSLAGHSFTGQCLEFKNRHIFCFRNIFTHELRRGSSWLFRDGWEFTGSTKQYVAIQNQQNVTLHLIDPRSTMTVTLLTGTVRLSLHFSPSTVKPTSSLANIYTARTFPPNFQPNPVSDVSLFSLQIQYKSKILPGVEFSVLEFIEMQKHSK